MHEIHPTGRLKTLLKTYKDVGGMIDYVLIGGIAPEEFDDPDLLHKAAAGFTIEAATARYPQSLEKGPTSRREPGKAQGTLLSPAEFFTSGYVWVKRDEIMDFPHFSREEAEFYVNDWNVQLHNGIGYYFENYHYAFSYPPYHSKGFDDEQEKWLFPAINQELFGDNQEALTIYSWSTDWADYFNDGHEWWGSFLWTVYSKQTKQLVGIAASTSD